MSAVLIQVAEALTAELNAHTFSQTFTAERSYADWKLPLQAASDLRVDVVPIGKLPTDLETRGSTQYTPSCHVVLRQKFGSDDLEQLAALGTARVKPSSVDPLVALVEELHEWLIEKRLTTYSDAIWKETEIEAAVLNSHLAQFHQFTAVIRLTFDVSKAIA